MSVYAKFQTTTESATPIFGISVADNPVEGEDPPPPTQILCDGMYEWAADWLVGVLGTADYPGGPPSP